MIEMEKEREQAEVAYPKTPWTATKKKARVWRGFVWESETVSRAGFSKRQNYEGSEGIIKKENDPVAILFTFLIKLCFKWWIFKIIYKITLKYYNYKKII